MWPISSVRAPSCDPNCGNPDRHADLKALPTPGQMLAAVSGGRVGGVEYDREWPERAKTSW